MDKFNRLEANANWADIVRVFREESERLIAEWFLANLFLTHIWVRVIFIARAKCQSLFCAELTDANTSAALVSILQFIIKIMITWR